MNMILSYIAYAGQKKYIKYAHAMMSRPERI